MSAFWFLVSLRYYRNICIIQWYVCVGSPGVALGCVCLITCLTGAVTACILRMRRYSDVNLAFSLHTASIHICFKLSAVVAFNLLCGPSIGVLRSVNPPYAVHHSLPFVPPSPPFPSSHFLPSLLLSLPRFRKCPPYEFLA